MASSQEKLIAERVKDVARNLGYEARAELDTTSPRLFGWFRNRESVPDVVLRQGSKTAVVEIKTRPVVTYDVFQIERMRGESDLAALICVPDPEYQRIAPSVRLYAEAADVTICPISGLDDALQELL